jgi:hypothetical protein
MKEKLESLIALWENQIAQNLADDYDPEFVSGVKCAYECAIEDLEKVIKEIK